MNAVDFEMKKLLNIRRLLACLTLFVQITTRYVPQHAPLYYDVYLVTNVNVMCVNSVNYQTSEFYAHST